jgi:hypothetical protein
MHMLGLTIFVLAGVSALTGLSVSIYASLPKTILESAERHGRFQGLRGHETLIAGTRAGDPPAQSAGVLEGYAA